MSVTSFHRQFKAVTGMSPLQYQKTLRLQEARRLMLTAMTDAGSAGRRVGYMSPAQFSREYSRFFGDAPTRDIHRLRKKVSARLTRGWTILVAAQRCGTNPNYLGALEKGGNMPSVDTLLEMADVYGVNASDIVREVEEARRAARKAHAAAVAANMPPVE